MKKKIKAKKKVAKKARAVKAKPKKSKLKIKTKPAAIKKKTVGEKPVGTIEHFFGHISVAALRLKKPLKAGDMIHIKGHTTDFVQKVESMQIEHESITSAKKGDDVGLKVKDKCRTGDEVFIASNIPAVVTTQPLFQNISKPAQSSSGQSATKPSNPSPAKKASNYEGKKFLSF